MSNVRVRIADGRQVVTDLGHHFGGEELAVPPPLAEEWVRFGWAVRVEQAADKPAARGKQSRTS
ncbi:hypothetical protein [Actinomadura geliboluensis]|uniref:Uncharacterized protein n=1 Tax=Actinomadura geliboluensis TaxID=882440 RepID=A0A5S4H961_9ACTN|nr:hypothetical protein [Actinomadura geliboluensis]TMR41516.1 hypothetical protein ETD96_05205 [Actinomadura geliboluensis]